MKHKWVLLFCVVILDFQLEALASSRSGFGEECSKFKKCDRKAWLSCYDGTCDCSRAEEMFYDEAKGKCVTKSGERCRYGVEEDGDSSLVEITECVTNSKCEEDGVCVCDSKYHEVFNGTCELSKRFGQICSEEDKCSKFLYLHCINGVCNCKDGVSAYSSSEGRCVGAVNKNCIDGKCLDGAECKDGKCLCDLDHYENKASNTCDARKRINEECSDDSECTHKGLFLTKCKNGKCECDEGFKYSKVQKTEYSVDYAYRNYGPIDQYFRLSSIGPFVELCAPLIGKPCPNGYCVPNSQCKMPSYKLQHHFDSHRYNYDTIPEHVINNRDDSVCECTSSNQIPSKDKSGCGKKWMNGEGFIKNQQDENNKCGTNEDCVNNLVCYESRCKCPSLSHQKVNSDKDYCLAKVGGPCSTKSDCVRNSVCKLLSNDTLGHCQCSQGFVDNKDGECEGSHGTVCDYKGDIALCDKAAGLVCVNKKCSCKDNVMYRYSEALRKCVGLVGARCLGKNSCVDNAECFSLYPGLELPGRCKCKKDYQENSGFTCQSSEPEEL